MHIIDDSFVGITKAAVALGQGATVGCATETCYGLGCDLQNPDAVKRLFDIKQRPYDMPVSALFASVEHAQEYVEWNEKAQELADAHLPGPLTIILPLRDDRLTLCPNGCDSAGVRISPHPAALALVEAYGSPIATTSANAHGQSNPYSVPDIQTQYKNAELAPDVLIDSGELPGNDASTVVKVDGDEVIILRGSL